jgi:Family of unknown function (DUF6114)
MPCAVDSLEEYVATASDVRLGFRRWRRRRPFWGGLLLLLAGLELFFSANLTLGDMEVHIGPQGFLSYLLPIILLLCGLLVWFTPAQRVFYAVLGLLAALYSLIGLNLGGFFFGMLLGILGGALVLAWAPTRPAPPAAEQAAAEITADGEPTAVLARSGEAAAAQADDHDGPALDGGPARDGDPALDGAGAQPAHHAADGEAPTEFLPGFSAAADAQQPPSAGGTHRKLLVITLVPATVTALMLAAGSRTPARAGDDCPDGLPSRSATATAPAAESAARRTAAGTRTAAARRTTATPKKTAPTPKQSSTPSPASDDDEESDHLVLDGIRDGVQNAVDGVGKLLGIGGDESPSPSPSAPPSASPAPESTTAAPRPTATKPGTAGPTTSPTPHPGTATSGPARSAPPSPAPTASDVPCLGPRVYRQLAEDPDAIPRVSVQGATLVGERLTMYDSTYDGVVSLTNSTGTFRALKFSMTKSVTKPFTLTVPEAGGRTTRIESDELTIDGNVRFYTPRFQGKLFGLIPVTFTPDQPPPLTLPVLWFTDVKISLAFVRCDTLTAKPLDLSELR